MQTFAQHHTGLPRYDDAKVEDAMHAGVLSCPPETPLWTVARMMANYSVHSVVVTHIDAEGESDERAWGIVSSLALTRACVAGADEPTAGGVASTDVITVSPGDPLASAAQLMADHGTEHIVVADLHDRPVGVVSTRDVAAVLARR